MRLTKKGISLLSEYLDYWHDNGWRIEIISVYVDGAVKWNVRALNKDDAIMSKAWEHESLFHLLTSLNDFLNYTTKS